MNYKEALKTEQWYEKREEILKRDHYMCFRCERTASHVHHRYYLSIETMPWEYPDDALLSLCSNCHKREHNINPISNYTNPDLDNLDTINFPEKYVKKERKLYGQKVNLKKRIHELQNKSEVNKQNRIGFEKFWKDKFDVLLKRIENSEFSEIKYFTNKPMLMGLNAKVFDFLMEKNLVFFYEIDGSNFIENSTPMMLTYYIPSMKAAILLDDCSPTVKAWCDRNEVKYNLLSQINLQVK